MTQPNDIIRIQATAIDALVKAFENQYVLNEIQTSSGALFFLRTWRDAILSLSSRAATQGAAADALVRVFENQCGDEIQSAGDALKFLRTWRDAVTALVPAESTYMHKHSPACLNPAGDLQCEDDEDDSEYEIGYSE